MPEATASTTRSVMKVVIKGSIDAVWREITRTGEVIPCFFNMRMDCEAIRQGAKLAMRSKDGKYTGVVGEILDCDPPHRFSHTFQFTNRDEPPCRVVYELREVAEGTEFTLTIEDLVPGTKTAKQMIGGAKMIANTLKDCIETGRPSTGTRVLFSIFALTAPLTPKRCLSEHWPV